jgi:putative methyltransferase
MKKIYFFKFDTSRRNLYLPYMYFGFKRYYEVNGKYPEQWEWIPPEMDYTEWTIDDIVDKAVEHNADVYAFTTYMWNWNLVKAVAEKIKQRLPNAVTVLGGPHQGTSHTSPLFWFKKYPYFDATCTPTEYGEWFITDCLDAIVENNLDWSQVRNSFHRKGLGPVPNKREFKFPDGIIESNLDEALKYKDFADKHDRFLTVFFETTRGCPYGCTYCEWSGGINTKVITRELDQIRDEFSYFPMLNVKSIYITDANFGIIKDDEEKAKMIADLFSVSKNKFWIELGGLAKSSVKKRLAVLEPLFESGALLSYQMSIQTSSEEALSNVDRTDITVEENVEMAKYLIKKYNATIHIEFILGLPGYTLNDFYDEFDAIYQTLSNYGGVSRGPLLILPDSPAADPEYIKKFNLNLVPIGIEAADGEVGYDSVYNAVLDPQFVTEPIVFIPVSCDSYTTDDWKQMNFMADVDVAIRIAAVLESFVDFLFFHRNIKPSLMFRKFYQALKRVDGFYKPAEQYIDKIIAGELGYVDWRIMEAEPGFAENANISYLYLWAKNKEEIYQSICDEFKDLLDEQSLDLLEYLKQTTFRLEGQSQFTSLWDWSSWEGIKDKTTEPEKRSVTYITVAEPIVWRDLDPLQFRFAHTKILNDDGSLTELNKFILRF